MRLATRSWGREGGPLAVLVHGVTGSSRTWWRVGPWLAGHGWRVVAPDLRGHGSSPRLRGGEDLADLARDVHETVSGLEDVDVLLGHSLGALVALELCRGYGGSARRVVLEEPPGSVSTNFEEVAQEAEAGAALVGEPPEAVARQYLDENPSWAEEDARNSVAGLRDCEPGPVARLIRAGLRFDLAGLAGSAAVPTLLVLGSEGRGSMLPSPEREVVIGSLRQGTAEELDAGHGVHRDDFEGYVRLLAGWLEGPTT